MTTLEKINLISSKVQQLLNKQQDMMAKNHELSSTLELERSLLQKLHEENTLLKSRMDATQKELERRSFVEVELKIKVSELEAQVDNLKNTKGTMDEASRKAMEKQLNHYIKEIDKCIALLSQ